MDNNKISLDQMHDKMRIVQELVPGRQITLAHIIANPGEYAENGELAVALALYTYEADIVGLLIASDYPYNPFPPCCTSSCNREVIGLVTGIDKPDGNPDRVENWLRLAGCKTVFRISSYTGEGIWDVIAYLDDGTDSDAASDNSNAREEQHE